MFSVGDLVILKTCIGIYKINHINKKGHVYLIGMNGQHAVCTILNLKIYASMNSRGRPS